MKYKIVCIDDEADILDLYEKSMQGFGYDVEVFTSTDEAETYINQHQNSIVFIFSDFSMPSCDGFSFRKRILNNAGDIPFALITGFYDTEMALKGMDLKICSFLKKPFSEDELEKLLTDHGTRRKQLLEEEFEMVSSFIEETYPMLEEIEDLILTLETDPNDVHTLNTYFRLLHTIKGTSACVGLKSIPAYTHKYEDLVTNLKNKDVNVSQRVIDTLLIGLDELKLMFNSIKDGVALEFDIADKLHIFDQDFSDELSIVGEDVEGKLLPEEVSKVAEEKINVSIGVLDDFMELSGELTVLRNTVLKSALKLEHKFSADRDVEVLSDTLEEMHKVSSLLQYQITEMRKVSIESIYKPLKRVVRDACKAMGKKIEFQTEGEHLRVDTSLAKVLSGALIHLIRNGVDHGIELPEKRVEVGKDQQGSILLKTFEEGEHIVVEIEDNGNGLDTEKIKAKALENKLFSSEQLSKMSEQKIYSLIFESGFSTAHVVTDISGRGVGMDMVKSSVKNIGGKIHIHSKLGHGSKFTLNLPIPRSVLIIKSLMVSVKGHSFCLPLEDVSEVVNYCGEKDGEMIHRVEGGVVLKHHGSLLPLLDVGNILEIGNDRVGSEMNIVIVRGEEFKYGIIVDQIHDIEEVVCKKMSEHLKEIPCFQGATFVGDGEIALVWDLLGLAEMAKITLDVDDDDFDLDEEEFSKGQEFMQFRFLEKMNYAIPLERVVRLEEFSKDKIEKCGNLALIKYRENTLPLIDVESLLNFNDGEGTFRGSDVLKVIVVSRDDSQFGMVVHDIQEIGLTDEEINFSTTDREGIQGTVYINEKTVNVLDVEFLIENYKKIKPKKIEIAA
ncbi:hypothetical protein A9Q84_07095 [Halobacteriovorax marinus]|uniref:Chemotaxis protein CheA n=1 Tax=Halobacteriovorax marinus TaxID=97084 RepID=A0A1Y5FBW1_9BACT|nr:hypothetical protein A9Q84_07095 [Halobacteriovorax marinus]